ncbi:MAG TPA: ATP synthase F1 subunit epsilon [Phycisphaerae bacterium]|nr:ATP synthase F1 subunit epsilon [Phycisphaerae bacterium]
MATDPITCSVITPERQVLQTTANSVVFPAHDGLVGILKDRAPLLCELGAGPLRVEGGGGTRELFVDGGFAQVLDNQVTILTERAIPVEDLTREKAQAALSDAEKMPASDEAAVTARQKAIDRAKAQIHLAKK